MKRFDEVYPNDAALLKKITLTFICYKNQKFVKAIQLLIKQHISEQLLNTN